MFTAAIGIDCAIERDIRRAIEGNDTARRFLNQRGAQRRSVFLNRAPAIIVRFAGFALEPAGLVRDRSAAAMVKAFAHRGHVVPAHPAEFLKFLRHPHGFEVKHID